MASLQIPAEYEEVCRVLADLHGKIRQAVRELLRSQRAEVLAHVAHQGAGDVSFQIDLPAEELILQMFTSATHVHPIVVVSEGIGQRTFPSGARAEDAKFRVLIDPLDGSRELAFQRRSAWIESGVAPNRGAQTTLADIVVAMQTEIPPAQQPFGVVARAVRGKGAWEQTWDLGQNKPIGAERRLRSSRVSSIRGGFVSFVHYFPGTHEIVGRLADRVFERVLGPVAANEAAAFDDQYISTAGLLYLLASGRHRFCADLRPEVDAVLARRGRRAGLCAHPYDLSCALVAEEAGVVLTEPNGGSLKYPLDTLTDCGWCGYANRKIYEEVAEVLHEELRSLSSAPK